MNSNRLKGTFVVADPQALICRSLKEMLSKCGAKVHTVSERRSFQALLRKHRVDLVIADYPLLFKGIMEELPVMIRDHPDTSHLALTSTISESIIKKLSRSGIRNVALKTDERNEIIRAAGAALAGMSYYSRDVLDLLLRSDGQNAEELLLTPTEIEIVTLITGGLSVKDIAERKLVGVRSVMAHRKSVFRKLGVSDSHELKLLAIKTGLIDNIEYHI